MRPRPPPPVIWIAMLAFLRRASAHLPYGLAGIAMSAITRLYAELRLFWSMIFSENRDPLLRITLQPHLAAERPRSLISTVAVMPAARMTPAGTSSIWMRTGMRCARRTQVKMGLTLATP
jgi:hypothetical protein